MQTSEFIVRSMELSDLPGAMRLSTDQGWNQTMDDWKMMIENPINCCLVAEYNNKIVGTTTAINYSNEVAWISMVLVDKDYRGHGISKILLERIFKQLSHCKSLKLDATSEGQPVYRKYNFIDEYSITRMTCHSIESISTLTYDAETVCISHNDIPEINTLDQRVFGADRIQLIEYLLRNSPGKVWMLKRNNSITGYALGRAGRKYTHIGPVIAASTEEAQVLISKSLIAIHDGPFVVDVMNDKTELVEWLHSIGFLRQRSFIRMYQSINFFPGTSNQQYLICGPEFG